MPTNKTQRQTKPKRKRHTQRKTQRRTQRKSCYPTPSKWIHHRPKNKYAKFVRLLGKPAWCVNEPHGMAMWRPRGGLTSLFDEHILRDEDVPHCVPAKHHDYFYSSVRLYVPPSKRRDVLRISGSIAYDGLKKMLTARCASIEANIATLYLGMCVATGKMDISYVKRAGLYGAYIRGEKESHDELKRQMMEMKRDNHKKNSEELKAPRDPLAFRSC